MRNIVLVLTLAAVASLLAQSASSYRITHTYTLGGDGRWDYIVPDPPNHRLFIARQNRVMVVDEDSGKLLGEVTGIQGAHGTALAPGHGPWIRHFGQRPVRGHVRSEDLQGARPDSGRRRCRRDHLRQRIEPRLHVQWRRALLDRDRPAGGDADHEHSARRQTGIRRVRRRRQGVRESHRHQRGGGDRREDGDRDAALVHRAVQAAGLDGHRHRAPSAVQRMPQRRDGGLRLSGRQGGRDAARSARASTAPRSMRPQATRSRRMRTARSP